MSENRRHTVIIGGGVIGVACAHYLTEAGHRVTVIDKGRIGGECSQGNCGLVCPSHVLPLAEPGAIRNALKAMLKPGGAFRIRPRLNLHLWRWLWRFARRCNERDMLTAGRAIQPLLVSSMSLYEQLVESGIECEWQKRGLLFVYQNKRNLNAYEPTNELLASTFNEPAQRLDGDALLAKEPALKDNVAGAWFFEHDAHLRPDRLLASWRAALAKRGVQFIEQCELQTINATKGKNGEVSSVVASGKNFDADKFVIATGAWTPQLAKLLRCRVPIEPGKGYSITLPVPANGPKLPMIFPEHRVAVTPMDTGLRLGSIMEFAGYDQSLSERRLRMLTAGAAHYLREPIAPDQFPDKWFGWRPMTYDSTPVIGRCPTFSNVYLATGHNMLGLSMAPATGRLISELIDQRETHIDAAAYALER